MPLIDIGADTLHVVTLGEGAPVVMLHGLLLGSLAQWYFTAAPVLARDHRVVLFDLPGHGRSGPATSGFGLVALGRNLDGVLASTDTAAPVDLVGHSWGGLVALRWALDHPGAVRRLVLVDVPLPPSGAEALGPVDGADPEALLALLPDDIRAMVVGGGRRARRLVQGLATLAGETTLLADVDAEPDIEDHVLRGLQAPTLVIVGETSACRPAADRLAATLPDVRTAVLPGGHFLPVESAEALTAAIVEFIDG